MILRSECRDPVRRQRGPAANAGFGVIATMVHGLVLRLIDHYSPEYAGLDRERGPATTSDKRETALPEPGIPHLLCIPMLLAGVRDGEAIGIAPRQVRDL
jgi:hypothetical protein